MKIHFLALCGTLFLMSAACGSRELLPSAMRSNEAKSALSDSFETFGREYFADGELRFESETRVYRTHDMSLGIKLGLPGCKLSLSSDVSFDFSENGELRLVKLPADGHGRLFKDHDTGALLVLQNERFEWSCAYRVSAALKNSGNFQLSIGGAELDRKDAAQRVLYVTRTSDAAAVQDGDTLRSLDARCQSLFATSFASSLTQDLADALKAELTVTYDDTRADLLSKLAAGEKADVRIKGRRMVFYPPVTLLRGNQLILRGELELRNGFFGADRHSYIFVADQTTGAEVRYTYYPTTNNPDFSLLREMERFVGLNLSKIELEKKHQGG